MKRSLSFFVLAMLAVVGGCRTLPYFIRVGTVSQDQAAPAVEQLAVDPSQISYLSQGRHIFVTKCTKCHAAMPIRNFAAADWTDDILPTMSKKAKLTVEETEALTEYIVAVVRAPKANP